MSHGDMDGFCGSGIKKVMKIAAYQLKMRVATPGDTHTILEKSNGHLITVDATVRGNRKAANV